MYQWGKDGMAILNSITSTTTKAKGQGGYGEHKPNRIRFKARVEEINKAWYQGTDYVTCGHGEAEYFLLGFMREVTKQEDWR
ncbi:MAG TPA: hypothetical protein PKL48_10410 [Thermodesulfobacteriota bacterium]|nr:hypothetical protein [Thermodesulfobacteriota bacterium]